MAKRAPAEKLPIKNAAAAKVRSDSEKLLRALILLVLILIAGAALVFSLAALRRTMFTANPRFELRRVNVRAEGFWNEKSAVLCARLGIRMGENLYRIDPLEIRRRLAAIPSVEHCEVVRELPDTLNLRIIERIPRAVLYNPRSPWVVDENGVVMPRQESMTAAGSLPVIFGLGERRFSGGEQLVELTTSLELILLTLRGYPDIQILSVDISRPDKLEVMLRFRNRKICKALIPNKLDQSLMLTVLQSSILDAERRGDTRSAFDLSFEGNVILL